ncbi:MAG: MBL fold metallo-hydrolase [Candidatus Latescibacteria bacterium]|nr:MBL fold metallo-hydrolase [Candidatus Latescibacterota bacterium]
MSQKSDVLQICIIDVDQGDAILIMTPNQKYILIDGGNKYYGINEINPLLDSLKIRRLDYVFATHYDADHIGGLDEVINHISKDSIINYCYDRGDTAKSKQFLEYKLSAGNKRKTIKAGDIITLNDVVIKCVCVNGKLMNGDSIAVKDENDFCIGLVIEYKDFELFTAGDIGGVNTGNHKDIETKLAPLVGDIDVYKVSHHGSKYSSNSVLINTIKPEAAVISAGTNNYGHPEQSVIDRLSNAKSRIYQTNQTEYGQIPAGQGVILNGDVWIKVYDDYYVVNTDTFYLRLI